MLAERGVDAAHWAAWEFQPEQVEAVIARWEDRREAGEELGPGWIVWRLRQGPVKAQGQKVATSYLEDRYRRGKAGHDPR